jgi:hypothetical protein
MALPNGAGGYQLGDGNVTEVQIYTQAAPAAYTDTATLTATDLTNGLITFNNAADKNLQLPTVASLEALVSSAKVNSSFLFSVIALGAGGATLTTNTGWTLVGVTKVTASFRYVARKSGDGSWALYQVA